MNIDLDSFSHDGTVNGVRKSLDSAFDQVFAGADLITGLTSAYWSEGGEWVPTFAESNGPTWTKRWRDPLPQFMRVATVEGAVPQVSDRLRKSPSVLGITLGCNTGKTTKLPIKLFQSGVAKRIIVVLPSMITAAMSKSYVLKQTTIEVSCQLQSKGGLVYTQAGIFLNALAEGYPLEGSLIILDEAHMTTPVYQVLREMLARMPTRTLMVTGSRSPRVEGVAGTAVRKVDPDDTTLSNALADAGPNACVVGVQANQEPAMPANVLVGANLDIETIHDSGVRLDPGFKEDYSLEFATRLAQPIEITQIVSRVGRTSGSNTGSLAFYSQPLMSIEASDSLGSFYNLLERALRVGVGIDKVSLELPLGMVRALLNLPTGLIKKKSARKRTELVGGTTEGFELDPFGLKENAGRGDDGFSSSSSSVSSDSRVGKALRSYTSRGGEVMMSEKGDRIRARAAVSGCYPHPNTALVKGGFFQLGSKSWVPAGGYIEAEIPPVPIYQPDGQLWKKPYVNKEKAFFQGADVVTTSYQLFNVGDYDHRNETPRIATRVLAGDLPASYTPDERNAIMVWWNRYVLAVQGRVSPTIARQMNAYVEEYSIVNAR